MEPMKNFCGLIQMCIRDRGHIGMAVEEFRLRALTHGVKTEEDLLQKFCRVQLEMCIRDSC